MVFPWCGVAGPHDLSGAAGPRWYEKRMTASVSRPAVFRRRGGSVNRASEGGPLQASARASSSALSRALRVSPAARRNSARASSWRPRRASRSPRTAGKGVTVEAAGTHAVGNLQPGGGTKGHADGDRLVEPDHRRGGDGPGCRTGRRCVTSRCRLPGRRGRGRRQWRPAPRKGQGAGQELRPGRGVKAAADQQGSQRLRSWSISRIGSPLATGGRRARPGSPSGPGGPAPP
jgi:hypothetical protein